MSVVVAIKDGNNVLMACDSQVTSGTTKLFLNNEDNCKIWRYDGVDGLVVGGVGLAKVMQLVKSSDCFDGCSAEDITYKFLVRCVVPTIIDDLKGADGVVYQNDISTVESDFFFAVNGTIYHLCGSDLFLSVEEEWAAMGSGSDAAIGSLCATEGMDPKFRLVSAILAATKIDYYVSGPIAIMSTENDHLDIIENPQEYIKSMEK